MQEHALLLCGYASTKRAYRKLIDSAPSHWNVHTLNFRDVLNYGATPGFHDIIQKFLIENKLSQVTLIAHSIGGVHAVEFAYFHPESVKKMYLLNTFSTAEDTPLRKLAAVFLINKRRRFLKHLTADVLAFVNIIKHPRTHYHILRYCIKAKITEKAKNLKIPTTLIWGNEDLLLPVENAEKLHQLIPRSQLIVLKGQDHDWPIHSPELFWKNILNYKIKS